MSSHYYGAVSTPFDRTASCPNCGAPMEFRFAGAAAQVCKHCRFVVARTDRNLVAVGKMADLIELPNPLQVGATGRWNNEPFMVEGRVQLDRVGAAGAPWQEVLLGFPQTGRLVWVAAAQGRWYATSEAALPPTSFPSYSAMRPGMSVTLGQHGVFNVVEVGKRRVVSGEGELSYVAAPGVVTRFVDIAGPNGAFGTLDYGDGHSIQPRFYLGSQIDPLQIKLDSGAPVELPSANVEALACPHCGGNLPLAAPASAERIVCRYCGMACDLQQGALVALRPVPKPPIQPFIPLGQKGVLRKQEVICVGFVIRGCTVEGERYRWREYLLYGGPSAGYAWLTEEDGKWQFITPLSAGDVNSTPNGIIYRGKRYGFRQSVRAEVEYVLGEFYWKVEVGERVEATEFEAPDGKISVERDQKEVNYSFGVPISSAEIGRSFGIAPPPAVAGAGASPAAAAAGCALMPVLFILFVVLFVAIVLASSCGGASGGGGPSLGGPSFGGK